MFKNNLNLYSILIVDKFYRFILIEPFSCSKRVE